jgi:hypothetical protein
LERVKPDETPFQYLRSINNLGQLGFLIRDIKCGNYKKTTQAFSEIINANLDLETCTPADLEKIHGIGPKTSRFFIMWIRPHEKYAALDVHILRWLNSIGIKAPKSTPSSKKLYSELETKFLKEAEKRNMTPRELDLEIWEKGQRKNIVPDERLLPRTNPEEIATIKAAIDETKNEPPVVPDGEPPDVTFWKFVRWSLESGKVSLQEPEK